MFSSMLGGLGKGLLGSAASGGGSSFLDGLGSIVKGFAPMIQPLAGAAGTALGTMFGGPVGGMLGGSLGSSLGGSLGGLFSGNQNQQQQGGYGPQQSYGSQMGASFGNAMNQGFNQYLPQQLQGQTFSNIGPALGNYFGQQLGHPNAGTIIGSIMNPYLQNAMPQDLRGQQMGNFGGYLGNRMGQSFDQGMRNRGYNTYQYQPQMPSYGAPGGPSFGGGQGYEIPEAPAFTGGGSFGQGGYNIPEAPPFNPGAGYGNEGYEIPEAPAFGGGDNSYRNSFPQSTARSNMLSDIRNYRRPAQAQSSMSPQNAYQIPQAPPIGDLANYAPGGQGSVMRSSMHPGPRGNMFDEIRARNGGGYMGLRPTQTRASSAYPGASSNRFANDDFLARAMASRRNAIEPIESVRPRGSLTSGRY